MEVATFVAVWMTGWAIGVVIAAVLIHYGVI